MHSGFGSQQLRSSLTSNCVVSIANQASEMIRTTFFLLNWLWLVFAHQTPFEYLQPPTLHLEKMATISASSTCGTNDTNDMCITNEEGYIMCSRCEPEEHLARHALEGSYDTWWQSPSLAEGLQYHEVNLTLELSQGFMVEWIQISMANSPRPKVWALERSSDNGKTWTAWQYFAEDYSECQQHFMELGSAALCNTGFSHLQPYQNGEIMFSLLGEQCTRGNDLWRRATHIRFRFLRLHTGWPGEGWPMTDSQYYYAIREIRVGGRCICNGHATSCDSGDPKWSNGLMKCRNCQHNTLGMYCDLCALGAFRLKGDKKFGVCEPCNCSRFGSIEPEFCTVKGQCFCQPGFEGRQCDQKLNKPFSMKEWLNMINVH